jgi:hypothetical protein
MSRACHTRGIDVASRQAQSCALARCRNFPTPGHQAEPARPTSNFERSDARNLRRRLVKFAKRTSITAMALAVVLELGAGTIQSARAQTFTVLYTFTGAPDGANPVAGLVRDAAGNFYGTTQQRGIHP